MPNIPSKPGKDYLASGDLFFVFTSGTTPALGTDTFALATSYPGYVAGTTPPRAPRYAMFLGGQLDTVLANGQDSPIPAAFAGKPLPAAPATIKSTSTATELLVIW